MIYTQFSPKIVLYYTPKLAKHSEKTYTYTLTHIAAMFFIGKISLDFLKLQKPSKSIFRSTLLTLSSFVSLTFALLLPSKSTFRCLSLFLPECLNGCSFLSPFSLFFFFPFFLSFPFYPSSSFSRTFYAHFFDFLMRHNLRMDKNTRFHLPWFWLF